MRKGYVVGSPEIREGITYRRRKCVNNHWFWTQETYFLDKGPDPALTTDDMLELLRNERGD